MALEDDFKAAAGSGLEEYTELHRVVFEDPRNINNCGSVEFNRNVPHGGYVNMELMVEPALAAEIIGIVCGNQRDSTDIFPQAKALLDSVAKRHKITSSSGFKCADMRALAEVIMWEPEDTASTVMEQTVATVTGSSIQNSEPIVSAT